MGRGWLKLICPLSCSHVTFLSDCVGPEVEAACASPPPGTHKIGRETSLITMISNRQCYPFREPPFSSPGGRKG